MVGFFDALDQDKDGALTGQELGQLPHALRGTASEPARAGRGARPSFAQLDANSDRKVSREEWQGPAEFFARVDANGDGLVDEAEWASTQERGRGPSCGGQLLSTLDGNGDAKLSREEFSRLTALFDALDADQNDLLSPRELGQLLRPADGARK